MSAMNLTEDRSALAADEFGIGCRFSLHPMCDDFVEVILGALGAADATGLEVRTDDVSTYVAPAPRSFGRGDQGAEAAIVRFLRDVLVAASGRTPHVVASVLLSRRCPGEVRCEVGDDRAAPPLPALPALEPSGVRSAAHWSVYPLGEPDHLDAVAAAVAQAEREGTFAGSEHYATRLEGDISEVLTTIAVGWLAAANASRHVVSHATVSVGSPTARPASADDGGDEQVTS